MSWPTCRKFPRSMRECFRDADYAQAFWHVTPERRAGSKVADCALAVAIAVALALVLAYGGSL